MNTPVADDRPLTRRDVQEFATLIGGTMREEIERGLERKTVEIVHRMLDEMGHRARTEAELKAAKMLDIQGIGRAHEALCEAFEEALRKVSD